MKITSSILLAFCVLAGCATSSNEPPIGNFVMAGPTSADGNVASLRWQYGLQLSVDPKTISEIKFSCKPIPGTTFSAKGSDIRVWKNGTVVAEGPVLPITQESTPWLFENSTTSALCKAVISRAGQPESVVQAPVNFPASGKAVTVQQMKMAHEFNSGIKKSK
jgi:hypothetical protein